MSKISQVHKKLYSLKVVVKYNYLCAKDTFLNDVEKTRAKSLIFSVLHPSEKIIFYTRFDFKS